MPEDQIITVLLVDGDGIKTIPDTYLKTPKIGTTKGGDTARYRDLLGKHELIHGIIELSGIHLGDETEKLWILLDSIDGKNLIGHIETANFGIIGSGLGLESGDKIRFDARCLSSTMLTCE